MRGVLALVVVALAGCAAEQQVAAPPPPRAPWVVRKVQFVPPPLPRAATFQEAKNAALFCIEAELAHRLSGGDVANAARRFARAKGHFDTVRTGGVVMQHDLEQIGTGFPSPCVGWQSGQMRDGVYVPGWPK